MAAATPSYDAKNDQRGVDRQAPTCDEGSRLWKEEGCNNDCTAAVGRTRRCVEDATSRRHGEAQAIPLSVMQGSQKPFPREAGEMGATVQHIEGGLEVAKRKHVASSEWK